MSRKFKIQPIFQKAAGLQTGLLLFAFMLGTASCGPKYTYPANKVPESIENLCKKDYNIEVKARVVGKTVAAVFYRDGELDPKQPMSKDINEAIGKVMSVVNQRVALSTDLPLDYCVTFVRDRVNGTEVSITRSIDDTRRASADAIGVEEFIKRTVINQAKVRPGADAFIVPEVTQPIFLAQQIAQRARFSFVQNPRQTDEETETVGVLVEGTYRPVANKRILHFSIVSLKPDEDSHSTLITVLKSAVEVFKIYKFEAYDEIQMEDFLSRQKLVLDRQIVQDYIDKNISEEELLEKYLMETFYPQNSIRLFGMDLSTQDLGEAQNAPVPAASGNAQ